MKLSLATSRKCFDTTNSIFCANHDLCLSVSKQKTRNPGHLWNYLISFTLQKLFGKNCSELDTAVTVLAGRYSLFPVDILTQEALFANRRMATLHKCCSVSRECMIVSYVPEPVLGEGHACRMAKQFEMIIEKLSQLMGKFGRQPGWLWRAGCGHNAISVARWWWERCYQCSLSHHAPCKGSHQ